MIDDLPPELAERALLPPASASMVLVDLVVPSKDVYRDAG